MSFSLFVCNNMEEAWIASICAQQEREMEQWEIDEDRDHEELLGREAVEDGEVDAWPWYADDAYEMVEPEIVEDADLCGLAVERQDDDYDDELTVEAFDADHPDEPT